jgi:hypothetical protein
MAGRGVWAPSPPLKRSLSLGELLLRFFGNDLGEFSNNDDVTFFQPHLQKGLNSEEADSLLAE